MNTSREHQYRNYRYNLISRPVSTGEHQGIILVLAHEDIHYEPPIEISTPTTFKKAHAAEIEAAALAFELINNKAIDVFLLG